MQGYTLIIHEMKLEIVSEFGEWMWDKYLHEARQMQTAHSAGALKHKNNTTSQKWRSSAERIDNS